MVKWIIFNKAGGIPGKGRRPDPAVRVEGSRWNFYAAMGIVAVTVSLIPTWPRLPLFMDAYYHLTVMRGFADAGGWVGQAFWEYAPVGRVHLYPPLFHLFELALFRLGMSPMGIAKCCDFFVYPLFLFSMWSVCRRIAGPRAAFFFLALLSTSYALYLAVVTNIPFVLALMMGAWAYYFFLMRRTVAGALFLTAMFYTHTLMAFLAVVTFGAAAWCRGAEERRTAMRMAGGALALAAPFFFHQIRYVSYLAWHRVMENSYIDINLVMYGLAAAGLFILVKARRERDLYFVCLSVGLTALLATHPDRFFSGCGLVPLIFFAATAVDAACDRLTASSSGRMLAVALLVCLYAVLYAAAPVLGFSPLTKRPVLRLDSFMTYQMAWDNTPGGKAATIYYPKLVNSTVELLARSSGEGEIVFSNFDYAGGMVAMLAHRPTSFAMLQEVRPRQNFDPIGSSRWLLWFKDAQADGYGTLLLRAIADRYAFRPVGESKLAYLYVRSGPGAAVRPVKAALPQGACFFLMGLWALGIAWDIGRKRIKRD